MFSNKNIVFILVLFLTSLASRPGLGQFSQPNHPELEWFTMTTEHFEIHFHAGAERSARVVAQIAEEIYGPVTQLYQYQPDGKVHFIIKDHDDNSNGAAFYYDNKVEIWAPQMTFILRGTHNWLRNVVTHEFTHMISLGAARKISRQVPAVYFQAIGYEEEKRPDVLYGYPNVIVSYPLAMTSVPMWWAEGVAQFQVDGFDYDRWDSHRDMLIRTAALADKLFSFDEMGYFGKNSLGNERVYNSGYALIRYIARQYGQEKMAQLAQAQSSLFRYTIDGVLKDVLGVSAKQLYEQWQGELSGYYRTVAGQIAANQVEGKLLVPEGIANVFPIFSPDGQKIAYAGSKNSDYLSFTHLMIYNLQDQKARRLVSRVDTPISWSPDGKKLVFGKIERGKNESLFYDLVIYDLESDKSHQITHGQRLHSPTWSPDGQNIIAITQADGTDNLVMVTSAGKDLRPITHYRHGEAIYTPRFAPDGKSIVCALAANHGRDVVMIDVSNGQEHRIVADQGDARDPVFSPDGNRIYFSWDRDGIFNIYSVNLAGQELQQWTNVLGGAFMPTVGPNGSLIFANFQYDGYKIAYLETPQPVEIKPKSPEFTAAINRLGFGNGQAESWSPAVVQARNYDDRKAAELDVKPYGMRFGKISFLPRLMVDYGTLKLGTYFLSSDVLDRYSLIGGASLNRNLDLDLFGLFEYRKFRPDLFLEFYAITRHRSEQVDIYEQDPDNPIDLPKVNIDIRFNLLEADLGVRKIKPTEDSELIGTFVHSRYSSRAKDFFFQGLTFRIPSGTYLIGNQWKLDYVLDQVLPTMDYPIGPRGGRQAKITYAYERNKFAEDFSINAGIIQGNYKNYNYHRLELDWREFYGLPWFRHSLDLHLRAGYIDRAVDDFFNFFAGGLPGLKGYPFYSIEGRKLAFGRLTYRFPIARKLGLNFLHITLDKVYAGVFAEVGNAFNQDRLVIEDLKRDLGAQLRMSAFSFYGFPTTVFFDVAYGLDRVVNRQVSGANRIEAYEYGKEWRYYFGVAFDFMD